MSQNDQILAYLRKGNTLTSLNAFRLFDCLRLAARIKNLRDAGVNVKSKLVSTEDRRFSMYWI